MSPELLKEILEEGDYAKFREDMLARALRETRRRRFRVGQKLLAMAAGMALIGGAIWASLSPERSIRKAEVAETKITIPFLRTVPLKPSQTLETRVSPRLVFSTDVQRLQPSISDSELLALF